MSKAVDFMFNNLSRIGQDDYNFTQDNLMNNSMSSYALTNLNKTNEKGAVNFAADIPTMNMKCLPMFLNSTFCTQ